MGSFCHFYSFYGVFFFIMSLGYTNIQVFGSMPDIFWEVGGGVNSRC